MRVIEVAVDGNDVREGKGRRFYLYMYNLVELGGELWA